MICYLKRGVIHTMIKIAIIDDDPIFLRIIKKILLQTNLEVGLDIDVFTSGAAFFNKSDEYKLLLVDIDMPGMSGIEIVEKISDLSTLVIYITGHSEYMESAFNVNVIRFVRKDEIETKLPEALKTALRKININQDVLWKTTEGILGFALRDIVYLEIDNRKCYCHSRIKKYELVNAKLTDLLGSLDDWFLQINRYQIINLRFVNSIINDEIQTSSLKNITFHLSRSRKASLLKKYTERLLRDD